jgi:hypothetical protein
VSKSAPLITPGKQLSFEMADSDARDRYVFTVEESKTGFAVRYEAGGGSGTPARFQLRSDRSA